MISIVSDQNISAPEVRITSEISGLKFSRYDTYLKHFENGFRPAVAMELRLPPATPDDEFDKVVDHLVEKIKERIDAVVRERVVYPEGAVLDVRGNALGKDFKMDINNGYYLRYSGIVDDFHRFTYFTKEHKKIGELNLGWNPQLSIWQVSGDGHFIYGNVGRLALARKFRNGSEIFQFLRNSTGWVDIPPTQGLLSYVDDDLTASIREEFGAQSGRIIEFLQGVVQAHRGQGIGGLAVAKLHKILKADIGSTPRPSGPAKRMWEKLGAQTEAYEDGGERMEIYVLRRQGDFRGENAAMAGPGNDTGGIDLTSDKALSVHDGGQGIKFQFDPGQLQQLENAPGFVPVIFGIRPLKSISGFLGLSTPSS